MTTFLAIQSQGEREAIVVFADTQATIDDEEGRPVRKFSNAEKIIVGESWVLGHVGNVDGHSKRFYSSFKRKKYQEKAGEIIERAINEGYFQGVNELNRIERKEGVELIDLPTFFLATNSPIFGFWSVDEFGNLKKSEKVFGLEYIALGSGYEKAVDYLKEKIEELPDSREWDTKIVIELGYEAMKQSERDIYTGSPIDIVVVLKDQIKDYSKDVREALERAEKETIESIIGQY